MKRRDAALAGVAAAAAAVGFGELFGGIVPGGSSLVLSVGSRVIDAAPPFVKDFAVSTLGTADKPALIIGVIVFTLLLGSLFGVLAARRRWLGAAGFALLGVVGGLAIAATEPVWAAILVAGVAFVAAIGTLFLLLRTGTGIADKGRRKFLRQAGSLVALSGLAAVAGRAIVQAAATTGARNDVVLQPPVTQPEAMTASLDVAGISPQYVSNSDFYRIDTSLSAPKVNVDTWKLSITGMVDHPLEFTFNELLAMPMVERDVTLSCVSNEVGGGLVGNARWQGVVLSELLDQAGVQDGATQIVGRSVDDFTVGFPTQLAFDGRTALLAVGMNGEPLPIDHGFPARMVVAGLYGYVSATKWLSEIELTTLEAFDAYWVPRGWAKQAPIKTESRIDVPSPGRRVTVGTTPIAGVAWAPTRGISKVEVQVDDGPWQTARLGTEDGIEAWRQWVLDWEATAGKHAITVRATDGDGALQLEERFPPRPDGATGWHSVTINVVEA
ncbi:MAG: molybdopterin-dependent oxidoreductase [Acidimicrobiia bacterium]